MVRKGIVRLFHYLHLALDLLAVGLALTAAYALRFSGWPIPVWHDIPSFALYLQGLPVLMLVLLVCYHYAGLYLQRRGISGVDEFSRILQAATVAFLVVIGLTFFSRRAVYSRVVLLYAWVFCVVLSTLARSGLRRLQVVLRRRGVGVSRALVVGLTPAGKMVADQLRRYPGLGYRLLGLVAEEKTGARTFAEAPVLGSLRQLPHLVAKHQADEVIFALPPAAHGKIEEYLLALEPLGVDCKIVSDLFGLITNPMTVDDIYGIPVFALKQSPLSGFWARFWKRALDLALTVPALIALSPLLLFLAALVKLSSPGPVLFRQERVGRGNRPFMVFKFRSMVQDAEKHTGPVWAKKGDSRTTPVGAWMRRLSLDELPQLFNVLSGEMSLVGPRPERPHFVDQFKTRIPRYLERHKVKAGLTGWAQAHNLRGDTPVEERVKYDIWYVENWTLGLDLKIILRTALDLFHHQDAY
ncbi:MAG: undecaprenyl-phosphate glucose phosphotransferase [candidate division FCPU426 bacterium]